MSVLTAIFQAVAQAFMWVFPLSESGHSSIFHDFAGRYTGAVSQLTGIIHIGIAIGMFIACFKLFTNLFINFFKGWTELFAKKLSVKSSSPQRRFMYMTIISFAFFIFYLIPLGDRGNFYHVLHAVSYNGNLLGEGICFALTGALLVAVCSLADKKLNAFSPVLSSVFLGIIAFLALPVAGASFVGGIFAMAIIFGMSEKYALRYAAVLSVPVLIVMGIIEICTGVTKVTAVSAIIGLIVSAVCAFFAVRLLQYIVKKKQLKYMAVYNIAVGIICVIIGIFEIVIK